MAGKTKGLLLDTDYLAGEQSIIRLFFSTKNGKLVLKDSSFEPYFYVMVSGNPENCAKEIMQGTFNGVKPKRVEIVEKKPFPGKETQKVLKIAFNSTKDVKQSRESIRALPFVLHKREYDIPFSKRYLIDKGLEPLCEYEIEFDEKNMELKSIKKKSDSTPALRIGAFDFETDSAGNFSDPKKNPILLASYVDSEEQVVFSEKKIEKEYVVLVKNEKELLEKLIEKINSKNLDIITTYNGDNFDFPYLLERAKQLGVKTGIGADGSEPKAVKKGLEQAFAVKGVQHVDAYQVLRVLSRFGIVNLIKFDLESVDKALFGEEKEKITAEQIVEIWHTGKGLERLAEYNRRDSEVTYRIVKEFLPVFVEIGKLVHQTLFDVTRSGASQLVEALLIREAFTQNVLVPNKPSEQEARMRIMQTYKGGFVREPEKGLHENLAVLDFTSLHPTIMISHNISPDTVDCEHQECREKNMSPENHWFCTKRKGFISSILERLFNKRIELKKEMKSLKKGSQEYNAVFARQQALKILLNSFYGTLAFSHFRWYSMESAMAVTGWSREYVQWVAKEAEKAGFKTIYNDTDSEFLKIPEGKTQKDVQKFLEKINSELPEIMNLELEGFYKRGIFVTKKSSESTAKKKYALIDYNGNLKIVGFEYVRRDWAKIAKETQRSVIEAILKEGSPEKAIEIVKKAIKTLKEGKAKKSDLVIYSQIKKAIGRYESVGPHVAAAKKAIALGKPLEEGSMIGYIVTRAGKSISDKAQLEEFVAEGNYDADYYIENQVIPAVIKIIRELGYSEEDLIHGGKQSSLGAFE
ncbi:MAG: DNA-directed DNA polymerase [Candidatus Diapherotrites archaeon]